MIKSINPATEEEIKSYDEMGLEEVQKLSHQQKTILTNGEDLLSAHDVK